MKIDQMRKGEWGKVRAFFNLVTEEGFTIKGFKFVQGIDGMFVGFPSAKGKDGEYYDTVFVDKEVREKLNILAHRVYQDPTSGEPVTVISKTEENGKPKITEEELPF